MGSISNTFLDRGQSFMDCSSRPRGQGGPHGHKFAPVTERVTPARDTRRRLLDLLRLIGSANVIQTAD